MPASSTANPKSEPSYLPGFEPRVFDFREELASFSEFGQKTVVSEHECDGSRLPVFENEFWTAKQRAGHSLHEVSYRACFKPQLPAFFITRFTTPGDAVYDPFMGRGTTLVEASLLGRAPVGNDVNPLSRVLVRTAPCSTVPSMPLSSACTKFPSTRRRDAPDDLLVFYHPDNVAGDLRSARVVRSAARKRRVGCGGSLVANGRHQSAHRPQRGFFLRLYFASQPSRPVSPRNGASMPNAASNRITAMCGNSSSKNRVNCSKIRCRSVVAPPRRRVRDKGSRQMGEPPQGAARAPRLHPLPATSYRLGCSYSRHRSGSVALIVTSPPFLDVVQYKQDNWLRAWFCDIDLAAVDVWTFRKLSRLVAGHELVHFPSSFASCVPPA